MLKAFLTARQAYIMQCLSAATGAGADADLGTLACVLADVATMVGCGADVVEWVEGGGRETPWMLEV